MKQIRFTIEIDDSWHADLKLRAAESMRKIPAQLVYEAKQYHESLQAVKEKKGAAK